MIIDKLLSTTAPEKLNDKTRWFGILMELHDKNHISTKTLLAELGIDSEREKELINQEANNAAKA